MNYRAEIDGLRAIAVLPVIFFHAGFKVFSGGFVGVDIFFVISGYLITKKILNDLEQGTYSLISFYENRARRILPALFLMLLVSIPIAWNLLLPADMKDFTRSLVAIALFSSNFLFWREAGYWESANELNPMAHTWSLAVEEQFYLVFPLMLMVMWRFRRVTGFRLLLLIGMASLLLAQWGSRNAPIANYFLLPSRAWELIIGAAIAYYGNFKIINFPQVFTRRYAGEAMGIIGLSLIAYSVFTFNENVPFPGVLALLPTIGTGLIIIYATPETLVGKLLRMRVLVGIGLVSYSAYLWHQPLLAFSRHMSVETLSTSQLCGLILATFLIATISWRFVEQPFRNHASCSRDSLFKSAIACSLLFIAVGITGHKTYGFVERSKSPISYNSLRQKTHNNFGLHLSCEGFSAHSVDCQTSDSPEILVWGDSYAVHLVQGILASNPEAQIIQLTKSVCGPFLDVAPVLRGHTGEGCLQFNGQVQDRVSMSQSVKYAVLSSPFTSYIGAENSILFRNGAVEKSTLELVDREFRKTLSYLTALGITPVVFSPPPSNGNVNIGKCLGRAEYFGKDLNRCNFSLTRNSESLKQIFNWLRSISIDYKVVFLDELLCPAGTCKTYQDETFFYRDHGHLSINGSSQIGKNFDFYSLIVDQPEIRSIHVARRVGFTGKLGLKPR